MKYTQEKWFIRKPKPSRPVYRVMVKMKDFRGNMRDCLIARCGSNEANANLIVRAPEMLEMLKVCVLQLPDETAEEVSELIAKAEGK